MSGTQLVTNVDRRSLELRLLGPLEAFVDGVPVPVSGPRRRALLIRLALSANEVVSKDRLVDDLWGDHPPPTVAKALQVLVSQLRDLLRGNDDVSAKNDDVLVTQPTGYMLRLQPEALDASRFEHGYAAARRAFEQHDAAQAFAHCEEALSLWRGPALVDVAHNSFAVAEAARLEELRLAVIELHIEAGLADAGHVTVIGQLESLVDRHPLREHLWALLALALYRSGRHAEAVRACTRLRQILREELGLEPSLEITTLEYQILVQDPALELEAPRVGVDPDRLDQPRGALMRRTNLPHIPTSFVDSHEALANIAEQLRLGSVVTLTGTGGVGKTRAAIEIAHRHLEEFSGGVFFVDLAPVAASDAVVGAVASSLPLVMPGEQSLLDAIADWIGDRRVLLVIDNCEHLVVEVAVVVDELVRRCWNLRILATSREALRVAAERVYSVPSLEAAGPGVQLFCERAAAADASFTADGHLDSLVRICERVDGIPLAIELAAARVRSLTVEELLERLRDRFRLLRGSGRSTLDRHHTLRATVSWSYQLLTDEERVLFDRVSVFAGGFDLRAAQAVCGFDWSADVDVFEIVSSLVDKSMIVADRVAVGTRFRLLETLRQYGEEQLELRGETSQLRDHHASYYADLTGELHRLVCGPRQVEGEARMAVEWDNIRAAQLWSLAQADLELAERLAEASFQYSAFGMRHEHAALLRETVRLGEERNRPSTNMLGMLSYWTDLHGNAAEAVRLAQRGLDVATAQDHPHTANCWWNLAGASAAPAERAPDTLSAFRHQEAAVANTADLDLNWWALACLTDASLNADRAATPALVQQLIETADRVRCPRLRLTALQHQGHAHLEESPPDYQAAAACYEDAAAISRATGDPQSLPLALRGLAMAAAGVRDPEALTRCHDALEALFEIRHWQKIWQTLESAALALASSGRIEQAAVILGGLDAHSPGFGMEYGLHFRDQARQLVESDRDHSAVAVDGAHMSIEELVACAVAACSSDRATSSLDIVLDAPIPIRSARRRRRG